MFERLRRVIGGLGTPKEEVPDSELGFQLSDWAHTQGLAINKLKEGKGFSMLGDVRGKSWRLELGRPSRAYIKGDELRARAELGISDDVSILILNRPLKNKLESQAYQLYTDNLQTSVDSNLPEELRWLSMYPEVGWDGLDAEFWNRYSVLAEHRSQAQAWLNLDLCRKLMDWPAPGLDPEVPFTLMLLRGKAYVRMEYAPASLPVLEHVVSLFTLACDRALSAPFASSGSA